MATLKDLADRKVSANSSEAVKIIKQDFQTLFDNAQQALKKAELEVSNLVNQTGVVGTDYDKLRKQFEAKAKTHTVTANDVIARANAFQKKLEAKAKQKANDKKAREKAAERAYRKKQIAEGKAAGLPKKAISAAKAREAIEEVIVNDNWKPMQKLTAEVVANTINSANAISKAAKAGAAAIKSKASSSALKDIFNKGLLESANALDTLKTNALITSNNALSRSIRAVSGATFGDGHGYGDRLDFELKERAKLAGRKAKRKAKYTSKKVINGITRYFYD